MKHWYGNKVVVVLLIHCHSLQAKYCWPYVIESRLNDLIYILNKHTNRKKRQLCQVITQGFSKEYKLTVDASDVGVGAVLSQEGKDDIDLPNCYVFLKHWQRSEKNNPQLKKNDLPYFYLWSNYDVHFIHSWCKITIPSHVLGTCKIKITD